MGELRRRAVDPHQYDAEVLADWVHSELGPEAGGTRAMQLHRLSKLVDMSRRHVLDVGAGTGWLLEEARLLGARRVVGVEPSARSVKAGRRENPQRDLRLGGLETLAADEQFDLVCAVMSLNHIADIGGLFEQLQPHLTEDAEVAALVPKPRETAHLGELSREYTDEGYAVCRRFGSLEIVDLVRSIDVLEPAAARATLALVHVETFRESSGAASLGLLWSRAPGAGRPRSP